MVETNLLSLLKQGRKSEWISWREENPGVTPEFPRADLREIDLRGWPLAGVKLPGADLCKADLENTDLTSADLTGADLSQARLSGAQLIDAFLDGAFLNGALLRETDFTRAKLKGADFSKALFQETRFHHAHLQGSMLAGTRLQKVDFTDAHLCDVNLTDAYLDETILCRANLHRACLEGSKLVEVDLEGTKIHEAYVYAISVWGVKNSQTAIQRDLQITRSDERAIRVDDLELAQFLYLILHNEKIRNVIDAMTSKVVLILGSFQEGRKEVLESVKNALRNDGYVPVLFDFEPSPKRDLIETIQVLAGLAHFVIADLTAARSVIEELSTIVRAFPSLPVQPILQACETAYALMKDLQDSHPWLRPEFYYQDEDDLLRNLKDKVIQPAENWRLEWKEMVQVRAENEQLKREAAIDRAKREESERQAAAAKAEIEALRRQLARIERKE